jgi:hypothetical protein
LHHWYFGSNLVRASCRFGGKTDFPFPAALRTEHFVADFSGWAIFGWIYGLSVVRIFL